MADEPAEGLSAARLIDSLCDEFERTMAAGQTPQIEAFLAKAPPEVRQTLLIELLGVEVDFRISRGEQPGAADYLQRFPELTAEQLAAILQLSQAKLDRTTAPQVPVGADADRTVLSPSDAVLEGGDGTAANSPRIRYFGEYELLREIARGGMGVVYEARQTSLNRPVALKMILAGQLAGAEAVIRFRREAEAAAQLEHPGIVPIFEIGTHGDQHYFTMGYVSGPSLSSRLPDHPLEPREAASLLREVATAVQYAHEHGVIHRDLKPSNILLAPRTDVQPGELFYSPKVTDFGLAKVSHGDQSLTETGQILGTPGYMPPEQASGKVQEVGPAADIYSLGAVLYACLTGRPPFQAASVVDTLKQVVDREPRPISTLRGGVPIDLRTICTKCLEKKPDNRYRTARELAEDLQRFLEGRPILARPVSRLEHARRWVLRNRVVSGLLAALVLLAVLGTAAYSLQRTATDAALGQVAAEQVEKQKTALKASETQARALQTELERLKSTEEHDRREKALSLIREASGVRSGVLANRDRIDPESMAFWDSLEASLRTEGLYWLSNSTLDRLQTISLDSRTYGDSRQGFGPHLIGLDNSGGRIAVPRVSRKSGSPVPVFTIELFDLVSGGQVGEFPLEEKSCPFPRLEALEFGSEGKRLHVVAFSQTQSRQRVVQTYSVPDGRLLSSAEVSRDSQFDFSGARGIRFDDGGKRVLILVGQNPVLWDLEDQRAVELPSADALTGLSYSLDGIIQFTADGLITTSAGGLVTRNLLTGKVVSQLKLPARYRAPVRSADGRWLVELKNPEGYQARQGVDLGILDATTGEEFAKVIGVASNVQIQMFNNSSQFNDPPLLAVSPDKPYAAVMTKEELIVCELPQGNILARRKLVRDSREIKKLLQLTFINSNQILSVTETPPAPGEANGPGVMSPGSRFQLQLWELSLAETSAPKTVQILHEPLDLAISPGGETVAAAGPNNSLRTLNDQGQPQPLPSVASRRMLGLSPDQQSIIEEGFSLGQPQVQVWELSTRSPRIIAPGRVVGPALDQQDNFAGSAVPWPRILTVLAIPDPDSPGIQMLDANQRSKQYTLAKPEWAEAANIELHPSGRFLMIQTRPSPDASSGDARQAPAQVALGLTVIRHPEGSHSLTIPQLDGNLRFGSQHATVVAVEPVGLVAYDLDSGQRVAGLDHPGAKSLSAWELGSRTSLSPVGKHLIVLISKGDAYQPLLWNITENTAAILDTTWGSQQSQQVRWSADGTRVVLTGRRPGASALTMEVWDAATREKLATTFGSGAAPSSDAPTFLADTNLMYLTVSKGGGQGAAGEVWDLSKVEMVRTHDRISSHMTRDGQRFATYGTVSGTPPDAKTTFEIIETTSGDKLLSMPDTPRTFSPDGEIVLCTEPGRTVRSPLVLWNIATQLRIPLQIEAQMSYDGSGPYAFDSTGRYFAVYDDQAVAIQVWNVASGKLHKAIPLLPYSPVANKPEMQVTGVAFFRDGSHLLAMVNGRLRVFQVEGDDSQLILPRHRHGFQTRGSDTITSVAFSSDGGLMATAGSDATVNVWDRKDGSCAGVLESFGGAVTSVRFHPTDNQVVTRDANGTLTTWDLRVDADPPVDRIRPEILWNHPSPDTAQLKRDAAVSRVAQLAVSRAATPKIAVPTDTGHVQIVDWTSGEVTASVAGTGQITGLAFHPSEQLLAVTYASKQILLVNPESGATVHEWVVPEFPLNGVAFSQDGKHVVTVGHDVTFWNIATGEKDFQHELPSNSLVGVVIHPVSGMLYLTSADQTLTIWNPYAIRDRLEALGVRWE